MDTAFYPTVVERRTGSGADTVLQLDVESAPSCGGPWSPDLQHGGPPTALLVRAAERVAALAADRSDLTALRVAAEFAGAVPVAPVSVTATIVRLARGAVLAAAELSVGGRACLQARVWLLPVGDPEPEPAADLDPPENFAEHSAFRFPYADQLQWRPVHGSPYDPGPASVWVSPRIPLCPGEEPSGLQRVALIADSASGVSSVLDWQTWSFANVDLDLHLLRPMRGQWLRMDAGTELGAGSALTSSQLYDRAGRLGAGLQTLLVRRQRSG